jgi:hypothetical protein
MAEIDARSAWRNRTVAGDELPPVRIDSFLWRQGWMDPVAKAIQGFVTAAYAALEKPGRQSALPPDNGSDERSMQFMSYAPTVRRDRLDPADRRRGFAGTAGGGLEALPRTAARSGHLTKVPAIS